MYSIKLIVKLNICFVSILYKTSCLYTKINIIIKLNPVV